MLTVRLILDEADDPPSGLRYLKIGNTVASDGGLMVDGSIGPQSSHRKIFELFVVVPELNANFRADFDLTRRLHRRDLEREARFVRDVDGRFAAAILRVPHVHDGLGAVGDLLP